MFPFHVQIPLGALSQVINIALARRRQRENLGLLTDATAADAEAEQRGFTRIHSRILGELGS